MKADEFVVELYKDTKKRYDSILEQYNKALETIAEHEEVFEILRKHSSFDFSRIHCYISSISDMEEYDILKEALFKESEEDEE